MKQTDIQFTFDESKLRAINLYFDGKATTLDGELQNFMEALYKKNVPVQVREYIDKLDNTEQPKAAKPQRKPPSAVLSGVPESEGNTRPKE